MNSLHSFLASVNNTNCAIFEHFCVRIMILLVFASYHDSSVSKLRFSRLIVVPVDTRNRLTSYIMQKRISRFGPGPEQSPEIFVRKVVANLSYISWCWREIIKKSPTDFLTDFLSSWKSPKMYKFHRTGVTNEQEFCMRKLNVYMRVDSLPSDHVFYFSTRPPLTLRLSKIPFRRVNILKKVSIIPNHALRLGL